MKISSSGIDLIKRFEGLRLKAYRDAVGVPTIGYGHTRDVRMGQTIDGIEAERLLVEDLSRFEKAVNDLVQVPLTQAQFDALVSFSFNVGAGALAKSTLLKKLNARDYAGAAGQFERWVFAGGKKLAGLIKRRQAERELFVLIPEIVADDDTGQAHDPDGFLIDLPTLTPPYPDGAAVRLLGMALSTQLTEEIAKELQRAHGLNVDGIIGPVTWRAILAEETD